MRDKLRQMVFFPRTVTYTVAYSIPVSAISFFAPKTAYEMARSYCWNVLTAADATVIVEGEENLVPGPVIVVANHQSLLDVPALISHMPYWLYFVAKRELQHIPFFGWGLKAMGHVLVDRKNREQATASINRAAERIRDGLSVMVFAEGTRSRTGEMAPFKKGAFVLAIKSGVPVLPVSIQGSLEMLPTGSLSAKSGTIRLKIHPAVPVEGYTLENKEALIHKVEKIVRSGLAKSPA